MTIRVLVVDDELGRLPHKRDEFLRRWDLFPDSKFGRQVEFTFITSQHNDEAQIENDAALAVAHVARDPESWSLVLLDMQFDHGRLIKGEPIEADAQFGLKIQAAFEYEFPALPVVQFTAQAQRELQQHDGHYLSKIDGTLDDLRLALVERGRISLDEKKMLLRIPAGTVVASESMIKLYAEVYRRARADTPILIRGETGTGKEHLARYFHEISPHASGPWVAVQINTLPSNLYESQLFGHEKGAFTGADKGHAGLFSQADTGTIFLDEIGALPADLQAKLLRAIGERSFRKLGGTTDLKVQCGVVSATQDDLESNAFRQDLLARFTTVVIPPLRERPQELLKLAEHFLVESQRKDKKRGMVLSASARQALSTNPFPDNARGVRNAIETAVLHLSSNSVIQPQHLKLARKTVRSFEVAQPIEITSAPVGSTPANTLPSSYESPLSKLTDLMPALQMALIPTSVDDLRGLLVELDSAMSRVKRELAFAALQRCRHPVTGKIKVQPAMQLITNNPSLSPMNAKRKLNELLGRNQGDAIDTSELEAQLVQQENKVITRGEQ